MQHGDVRNATLSSWTLDKTALDESCVRVLYMGIPKRPRGKTGRSEEERAERRLRHPVQAPQATASYQKHL